MTQTSEFSYTHLAFFAGGILKKLGIIETKASFVIDFPEVLTRKQLDELRAIIV